MKRPTYNERSGRMSSHDLLRGEKKEQQPNQLETLRASLKPYEQRIFELYNAYEQSNEGQRQHILQSGYLLQLFPEKKPDLRQSLEGIMDNALEDIMEYADIDTAFFAAHLVQFFPDRREQLQKYVNPELLLKDASDLINRYDQSKVKMDDIHHNVIAWWSYRMLFLEQSDNSLRQQLLEKITAHPEVVKEWDRPLVASCKMILPEYEWKRIYQLSDSPDPTTEIWDPEMMPDLRPAQSLHFGQMRALTQGILRFYMHAVLCADRAVIDHSGLHLEMEKGQTIAHVPLPDRSIL